MPDEPEQALDEIAEEGRNLDRGLKSEVKEDLAKAKGGTRKRPWWKVWART